MEFGKKKTLSEAQALQRLIDLCNRGEYCVSELLGKMRNWGVSSGVSGKLIHMLKRDGLVDDARYARSLAYTKAMNSHWGKKKIRLYLINKHIDKLSIEAALDEIDDDEYEARLEEALMAKARQLGDEIDSYEGRTKIFRYAVMKGYEPDLTASTLRRLKSEGII